MTAALARKPSAQMSEEEWNTRMELAAAYRLVAMNGWTDGIANHLSARVPGEETYLLNPFGMLFSEVTASSLVKVDLDGNIVAPTEHEINPTGFVIHSAVHAVRPDAGCVMHLHSHEAVAVSSLEEGLMPLNQYVAMFSEQVTYHEFEGPSFDISERERLAADLGDSNYMLLRHHGPLVVGATIGEAYCRMVQIQNACLLQVMTLSMGRPVRPMPEAARKICAQFGKKIKGLAWPAYRRELDAVTTDYMR